MNDHIVYIGLGSNLDKPQRYIASALKSLSALPQSHSLDCSEWYGSKAIGPGEQSDYINAVAVIRTQLCPQTLLLELQSIENHHGRQRDIRWGARTLDLDLLLFDDQVIASHTLDIPHPEMIKRNFVIYPLSDLAPELILPNGQPIDELKQQLSFSGLYRIERNDCKNDTKALA